MLYANKKSNVQLNTITKKIKYKGPFKFLIITKMLEGEAVADHDPTTYTDTRHNSQRQEVLHTFIPIINTAAKSTSYIKNHSI